MTDITVTMKLFGAFRRYGNLVTFTVPAGASVGMVQGALSKALPAADAALIQDSAIANDKAVLPVESVFTESCQLAILPPVCGG